MSGLKYANYEGAGQLISYINQYSQAVVVGNIVKTAGQGGWDENLKLLNDEKSQVDLAFENIEKALKSVGSRGWEDVYAVRSYHVNAKESLPHVLENSKKYLPNHKPVWTLISVPSFVIPEMLVEIEVEAYLQNK